MCDVGERNWKTGGWPVGDQEFHSKFGFGFELVTGDVSWPFSAQGAQCAAGQCSVRFFRAPASLHRTMLLLSLLILPQLVR